MRILLLLIAGTFTPALLTAQSHSVAMGAGWSWESSETAVISAKSRVTTYVDWTLGRLWGLNAGLEFQVDIKAYDHDSYEVTTGDATAFGLTDSDSAIFSPNSQWTSTYSLWDANLSPRVFLSWDKLVRITTYVGVDYNVMFTSVVAKVTSGTVIIDGRDYSAGDTFSKSHFPPGSILPVAGVRFGLSLFFLDYTRFLVPSEYGDFSWGRFNKDRWGVGIQARF